MMDVSSGTQPRRSLKRAQPCPASVDATRVDEINLDWFGYGMDEVEVYPKRYADIPARQPDRDSPSGTQDESADTVLPEQNAQVPSSAEAPGPYEEEETEDEEDEEEEEKEEEGTGRGGG